MKWLNENTYTDIITAAAQAHGLPVPFVQAVIAVESQFNPTAYRQESKPGVGDDSAGLMQITYNTAQGVGYTGDFGSPKDLSGLFEPATNINYGTAFLAQVLSQAGTIAGAASAYNGGYRPTIGLGAPADHAFTFCLARDTTGKCIQSRVVQSGEYANQPYVNAVLANIDYFNKVLASSTGMSQFLTPLTPTGATNPKLVGLLVGLLVALFSLRQWRRRHG